MSTELETAGVASLGGLTTRQKADLAGQPCRNCGEIVTQRYCTNCGQLAASFHRPIVDLIGETIGDTLRGTDASRGHCRSCCFVLVD